MTALCEISSETTNELSIWESASDEISSGSTPPSTTASSERLLRLCRISEVERPGSAGSVPTPHAVATSTRAEESETGRAPGRSVPSAPDVIAPGSPARRGIHASFAPDDWESATTWLSSPGVSAARSPTIITLLLVNPEMPETLATNFALSFFEPRLASGASEITERPRFLTWR